MRQKDNSLTQILLETKYISEYSSFVLSKIILLTMLFPLFFVLNQTVVYIFAYVLIVPFVLANILENKKKEHKTPLLPYCAKKYRFSYDKFTAEKYINKSIIILLVAWQLSLKSTTNTNSFVKILPSIYLVVYIILQMTGKIYFRYQIKKYYEDFQILGSGKYSSNI